MRLNALTTCRTRQVPRPGHGLETDVGSVPGLVASRGEILMGKSLPLFGAFAALAAAAVVLSPATAGAAAGQPAALAGTTQDPAFTNTPLISTLPIPGVTTAPNANSTGNSEPAITFSNDGTMAVDGLGWLPFQVNLWKGRFGATPSFV